MGAQTFSTHGHRDSYMSGSSSKAESHPGDVEMNSYPHNQRVSWAWGPWKLYSKGWVRKSRFCSLGLLQVLLDTASGSSSLSLKVQSFWRSKTLSEKRGIEGASIDSWCEHLVLAFQSGGVLSWRTLHKEKMHLAFPKYIPYPLKIRVLFLTFRSRATGSDQEGHAETSEHPVSQDKSVH